MLDMMLSLLVPEKGYERGRKGSWELCSARGLNNSELDKSFDLNFVKWILIFTWLAGPFPFYSSLRALSLHISEYGLLVFSIAWNTF